MMVSAERKKHLKKNYVGSAPLPASIKEKGNIGSKSHEPLHCKKTAEFMLVWLA